MPEVKPLNVTNEKDNDFLTQEIYREIKRRIVECELLPESLLLVQNVAQQLGVSRTPVREAMVRLRDEKLLTQTESRKFQVAPITLKWIEDVYSLRSALECYALRRIAPEQREEVAQELFESIERHRAHIQAGELSGMFEEDSLFHETIVQQSGNQLMLSWLGRLNDHVMRVRFLTASVRGSRDETLSEHSFIADNLAKGHIDEAEAALTAHLGNIVKIVREQKRLPKSLLGRIVK